MVLTLVARRSRVAYPIVLVVGRLALGFVPGLPRVALRPERALFPFPPPPRYHEALAGPFREYRANVRSIGPPAVGQVVATMRAADAVARCALRHAVGRRARARRDRRPD